MEASTERKHVVEQSIPLTTAIRAWAKAERRERNEELPAPEELVAYHAGELDGEANEELQRRLAFDPEAAREFLDLTDFARLQAPDEGHQLSEEDVQDALTTFRERVRRDEGSYENRRLPSAPAELVASLPPSANLYPFPAEHVQALRRRANLLAAAVLALAVVGGSWGWSLYHQLARYSGPRYAAVIDVEATRGERPHTISQQAEQILLLVHGADLSPYRRGLLEVVAESGEIIATFELNATPDQGSLLYLPLPRELLPVGSYRIRIYGADEGRPLVKEIRWALEVSQSP